MNDQRPTRWPCSADSSRNAGPSPRSFRNAETGVSQSSTNVWWTGMRLCSPASSRASSSVGVTGSTATAANEHLLGVGQAEPAGAQQHGEVVEHVRGLLGHALVGLLAGGAHDLLGLLLHLLADPRRVGQQRGGVGALRPLLGALSPGPLEARRRLVRCGLEVAGEEAGPLARVAGGTGGLDERQHGVGVAVVAERLDGLRVPGRRALVP